jgi:hypothetical protein
MKKLVVRSFVGWLLSSRALHLGSAQDGKLEVKDHTFRVDPPAPRDGVLRLARWPSPNPFPKLFDAPPALVRVTVLARRHFVRAAAAAMHARVQMVNREHEPLFELGVSVLP